MIKIDLLIYFTSELTAQETFRVFPTINHKTKMERHQP